MFNSSSVMCECVKEVVTESEVMRRAWEGRDATGGWSSQSPPVDVVRDELMIVAGAGTTCEVGVSTVMSGLVLLVLRHILQIFQYALVPRSRRGGWGIGECCGCELVALGAALRAPRGRLTR